MREHPMMFTGTEKGRSTVGAIKGAGFLLSVLDQMSVG